jgi:hypothetical protein
MRKILTAILIFSISSTVHAVSVYQFGAMSTIGYSFTHCNSRDHICTDVRSKSLIAGNTWYDYFDISRPLIYSPAFSNGPVTLTDCYITWTRTYNPETGSRRYDGTDPVYNSPHEPQPYKTTYDAVARYDRYRRIVSIGYFDDLIKDTVKLTYEGGEDTLSANNLAKTSSIFWQWRPTPTTVGSWIFDPGCTSAYNQTCYRAGDGFGQDHQYGWQGSGTTIQDLSASQLLAISTPHPADLSRRFYFSVESLVGVTNLSAVLTLCTGGACPGSIVTGPVDYIPGVDVSSVPVPAAAWLFGSGLIGLVGVARRKKA